MMLTDFEEFSAPLGEYQNGRLVFAAGASRLRLSVCQKADWLYQARFSGQHPSIRLHEAALTVLSPPTQDLKRHRNSHEPTGEICLNGAIPWEIEFRGNVSDLLVDLQGLRLHSLDILGDAQQIELVLSHPGGASFLYVSGRISSALFRRPAGVGVRLHVAGGVQALIFDEQHISTWGAELNLESHSITKVTGYYDICINGSAREVSIQERG